MRLALVIYGSLETLSGGYLYDQKLVEALRRCGDTVEIISLPWRSYTAHLQDNLSAALLERLAHIECDLLLQDELNHPSLFWLNARLRRRCPLPIFSIVHHLRISEARPAWQNRLYAHVERLYLNSVDGFIFNSETTRQETYRLAPKTAHRPWTVARPAGDRFQAYGAPLPPEHIHARARQSGPLRVIFVGNLIPRKGLHTLLEGVRGLPPGMCTLQVVGDPQVDSRYVSAVRAQIERSGLAERVALCGRLAESDLAALLSQAHVLAVPSSYEGFGIVYLEGMGYGLPAIAGTCGGAGEIVEDGRNGYLVDAGDAQTIAGRLQTLAEDRSRLEAMSQAARQTFLSHPTWENCTKRIRTFLCSFTGGNV